VHSFDYRTETINRIKKENLIFDHFIFYQTIYRRSNMKKLTIICAAFILLVMLPFPSEAQIPNPGFEQWTAGQPDGWFTNNIPGLVTPITQSSTKHSGSYALRGEVVSYDGDPYPPFIVTGAYAEGFPVSQRHATLTGYYQFSPVSGDEFEVVVVVYKNEEGIGTGNFITANGAASYTQFTVDIIYYSGEVPDLCDIMIVISGPYGEDYHAGSVMLLDDLSFSGTSAVQEYSAQSQLPDRFSLAQGYPNPFNPTCIIEYAVPEVSEVSVRIYDIMGREITTLFQGVNVPGFHEVLFQPDQLPGGVYFYRMTATALKSGKTFSEVKKAMYIK
jgi:hypothetical protein